MTAPATFYEAINISLNLKDFDAGKLELLRDCEGF
jgi:hypothetical protein